MLFIKHNLGFIWVFIENINALLFSLRYGKRLNAAKVAESDEGGFCYRQLVEADVPALARFFSEQNEKQLAFFKPHGFDEKSLKRMVRKKAFLMYGAFCGDRIVGYFFLRCFFIGKAFRGKIVDKAYQGRGIAKKMGMIMTEVCSALKIRQFATISKDNVASIQSSKAVNNIVSMKELKDGYMCIEYGKK